ncbi:MULTISPECIES: type II toxin-antitoxin system PrlF family antitoxin [Agrobacterium]|uniref:type II toxin-antitoxin system PrlF family antitoxin n=1 Tax=Agrobacterium TaxID=357 RepID=UPI0009726252|nr:type II toxin-antitoxin system PrlF family antitoxin [Agrobacterium sp. DSM 25558]SCX02009.1 HtrA suppressor protein SohA [Agrobacterium sp. DSM 25558]
MAAQALLEFEATITDRGQTTVPSAIRNMLGVKKGTIIFKGLEDGTVVIERKEIADDNADPVIGDFLAFLEADMASSPSHIRPLTQDLLDRSAALTDGVEVDLDATLEDD